MTNAERHIFTILYAHKVCYRVNPEQLLHSFRNFYVIVSCNVINDTEFCCLGWKTMLLGVVLENL